MHEALSLNPDITRQSNQKKKKKTTDLSTIPPTHNHKLSPVHIHFQSCLPFSADSQKAFGRHLGFAAPFAGQCRSSGICDKAQPPGRKEGHDGFAVKVTRASSLEEGLLLWEDKLFVPANCRLTPKSTIFTLLPRVAMDHLITVPPGGPSPLCLFAGKWKKTCDMTCGPVLWLQCHMRSQRTELEVQMKIHEQGWFSCYLQWGAW